MTRGQKILIVIGIVFLIWVVNDPSGAAEFVGNVLAKLEDAANAIINFFKSLFT